MGGALIRGMIDSGVVTPSEVNVSCSSTESSVKSAATLGAVAATSNSDAARDAEVIFLCVKPSQALDVVSGIAGVLRGQLLISVVTGIHADSLLQAASGKIRVIRSMPNTAVRLRQGITAVAPGTEATTADRELAARLFGSVGMVVEVREEDLDVVTAVSGSGPAFALLMLEALAKGGVEGGLSKEQATIFAAGALAVAAALVTGTGETPSALRAEITSPGGTTAAGLAVLEKSGFPLAVHAAVEAAQRRAKEISA